MMLHFDRDFKKKIRTKWEICFKSKSERKILHLRPEEKG